MILPARGPNMRQSFLHVIDLEFKIMSDTEKGEVKEAEHVKEVKKVKGHDKGMESDVEIVAENKTAKQFFEFALPTRGCPKDTAKRLGLADDLVNFNFPTQHMTPASIPPNWMPQLRITIKGDGSCFRSSDHVL